MVCLRLYMIFIGSNIILKSADVGIHLKVKSSRVTGYPYERVNGGRN